LIHSPPRLTLMVAVVRAEIAQLFRDMTFLLGSPPDEAALVTQEAAIRLLEQALADEDESIRDTATDILAQLRDQ